MRKLPVSVYNKKRIRLRSAHCFNSIPSSRGYHSLPAVPTIDRQFNLDVFRQRAFIPEKPIFIATENNGGLNKEISIPAATKWFTAPDRDTDNGSLGSSYKHLIPSQEYLSSFETTILSYELTISHDSLKKVIEWHSTQKSLSSEIISKYLSPLLSVDNRTQTFHHFYAPLSLFLHASSPAIPPLPQLYIAQAQIADLPSQLQDDLPTPRIVKEAGRGDIYDANIWMGIPPTYTPLHRDPNPNLFVQLVSEKRVRLFAPEIGASIYRSVQHKIGATGGGKLRGMEMMEGQERLLLDECVWGESVTEKGFEVVVGPGDALFIPKGWWHSIKSVGDGVTASVNWWFR